MSRTWEKDLSKKIGTGPAAPANDEIPDFEDMQKQMQGQTNEPEPAPAEPTATEDATTAQLPVDMPEPPATRSKKAGGKEKKGKKDTAEPVDKDKYSIYLPKEMSQSLRMAYVVTGRKFSHLAEEALEDMLYHKYQCHEKSCTCRFSMEAGAKVPTRCPVCGGNKISPVKYR